MDAKNPYLVVILIQCIYAGMYLLSKTAFDEGMSTFVFVFYRQAAATLFIAPVAIISERKRAPPPLSFMLLLKIFLLALVGITFSLNLYSVAMDYTSASVASATSNSVPVITFVFALLLGMETINLKSLSSLAKILGITLCVAGVATIAFYKGPSLASPNHHQLGHGNGSAHTHYSTGTWIKGCFFLITSNATWSLWLVLQGIVVTGVSFYLQAWCIEKKGPVFLALFSPLALVITIVFSFFVLGELVSLGSVVGGLVMVGGLYSVLWGKRKEKDLKSSTDGKLIIPVQTVKECPDQEIEMASPFHPL